MKLLKSLSSFVLPLIAMLITFSIYLVVNKIVDNYKKSIVNDYAIIVISNTPMAPFKTISDIDIKHIKQLNRETIIGDVKDKLSDVAINLLNTKLPYFYKIHLEKFPTALELKEIKKALLSNSNIKKVETFSSDHNRIYSLLILTQSIVTALFIVVLLSSFLLLVKQIKIWFFEHGERISIIQLHGGSLLYGSKPILNIILTSTVISSIVVIILILSVMKNIALFVQPEIVSLIPQTFSLTYELVQIVLLAIVVPLIAFFGLLVKYKSNV